MQEIEEHPGVIHLKDVYEEAGSSKFVLILELYVPYRSQQEAGEIPRGLFFSPSFLGPTARFLSFESRFCTLCLHLRIYLRFSFDNPLLSEVWPHFFFFFFTAGGKRFAFACLPLFTRAFCFQSLLIAFFRL